MTYDWAVIGAGPAGITAVASLIERGITPNKILWLDPEFNVGDLGKYWKNVSSNTKVSLFTKFLSSLNAFKLSNNYDLFKLDPNDTCDLKFIYEPLSEITASLKKRVEAKKAFVEDLISFDHGWKIEAKEDSFFAKKVILAMGSEAKSLPHSQIEIPLHVALDYEKLSKSVTDEDIVGVFGSSHSAIIALDLLVKSKAKKVYNFYRSPIRYAHFYDDWILFDNTGLKGNSAKWARKHIDGNPPKKLERYHVDDPLVDQSIKDCTKCVYAVGFKRRTLPLIRPFKEPGYHDKTGIIAPGLFGVGIAYPEGKFDRIGNYEYQVGIYKFYTYINRVMPLWLSYPQP